MRSKVRVVAAAASIMLTTGCLAGFPSPPDPAAAPAPIFDPTRFFAGRTHGEGTLDVRVGTDRKLRVEGMGRMEADGSFRLDQTVTFGDGAVETRVWLLRRVDATHFVATLSDAKGAVQAESSGSVFHLRYLLRAPAVYMEQWLYLLPDGRTVANRAEVRILGLSWARLAETITRDE